MIELFTGTKYIYKILIFIWFLLELNVFEEFCLQIKKRVICVKEAFSLSDLVEDIKRVRDEIGTEESIITITRTLKKKILNTFPEEILFYRMGNIWLYSQVMQTLANIAVLKDKALKVTSTRKLSFAINKPLRCNEWIFLFEKKKEIRFRSLDR